MNNTINEQFKEENKKIYENKITLDIDNNDDSLKRSSDNFLNLYENKMIKKISSYLKENKIDFDLRNLSELIKKSSDEYELNIKKIFDDRTEIIKKTDFDNKILIKKIDETEKNVYQKIKIETNKFIFIDLKNSLVKEYDLPSLTSLHNLEGILNSIDSNITSNLNSIVKFRNLSLKNTIKDTHKSYINLNKQAEKLLKKSKKNE